MMQKALLFFLFWGGIAVKKIQAQDAADAKGANSLATFVMHVPVGVFAESQLLGAGLHYSWSSHRFGNNVSPAHVTGFIATAGIDYFLGKQVRTAGYHFRYGNYLTAFMAPGIMANLSQKGWITLQAGPSMELYKSTSHFGWLAMLSGNYWFTEKIAVGPGISYRKYGNTRALWAPAASVSYNF